MALTTVCTNFFDPPTMKRVSKPRSTLLSQPPAVTDAVCLRLYNKFLPLFYYNPKECSVLLHFMRDLKVLVPFDSVHYVLSDHEHKGIIRGIKQYVTSTNAEDRGTVASRFHLEESQDAEGGEPMGKSMRISRQLHLDGLEKEFAVSHPDEKIIKHFNYSVTSSVQPVCGVCFIRTKTNKQDRVPFTTKERRTFKQLKPVILTIFRLAGEQLKRDRSYNLFTLVLDAGQKLAGEYNLSQQEYKIMTEMLCGCSNDEIAARNFITTATVKSHVQHIFRKTNTKSRAHFFGKFFSDPAQMEA